MLLRGDRLETPLLDVGIVMSGGILGSVGCPLDVHVDLWRLRFRDEGSCNASQLRLASPLNLGFACLIPRLEYNYLFRWLLDWRD